MTIDGNTQPTASSFSDQEMAVALLELANELAWATSLDTFQIVYINQAAAAMFNVAKPSDQPDLSLLSQLDWVQQIHPDERDGLLQSLRAISQTGTFNHEFRIDRGEADWVWVKARFTLCGGAGGHPKFIGVLARDQTRQLDAQRKLDEAEAVYLNLVESLPIFVFHKDLDGKIVFVNQRYCDELGQSRDQLIGKSDFDLFPEMAEKYRRDDAWVLATGKAFHDTESHPKGHDMTYVEVLKSPVFDADGQPIGIQGMFWDVTARKKQEHELLHAKEMAESASRAKSDFLANISHEIRTPLNGIIGITDLLLGSVREKEHREYLELIQTSSDALLRLINEVLDFSKIESGKMVLDNQRFAFRESMGETLRSLAIRAHGKNIELIGSIAPEVPEQVIGDLGRLRQVLINLIGNAIKFTHEGKVELQVHRVHANQDKVTLEFIILDTGIGIPAEKLDLIFAEFEQVDTSTTRKYGGTGLGLTIASRLVQLMGGNLVVQSELGKGSRFSFLAEFHCVAMVEGVPLPEQSGLSFSKQDAIRTQTTVACEGDQRPLQVMVVEDNMVNQKLAKGLLEKGGHHVTIAETGVKALELYPKQSYDLVLLDIQMPEMDGYEACKHLREIQHRAGVWVPIVALTAHASHEDRMRCLSAGMDEYLSKPIQPAKLFELIEKLTGHRSSMGEPSKRERKKAHHVDWQHAFDTVGGDQSLLVELIEVFIKDHQRMLQSIESAIKKQDAKELRLNAHALKGALTHLGGRQPAEFTLHLEAAGKDQDLSSATEWLEKLKQSLNDVIQEMNQFLSKN